MYKYFFLVMTSKVLEIKKSSSPYHIFSHVIVTNLFVFKLFLLMINSKVYIIKLMSRAVSDYM